QAIGPSRGGRTTKIHALTDVLGRPGVLLLTSGNASDVRTAPDVLAEAPGRIRRLTADKGYDADWLRADL
ncbi:transposase, partial [Methylobacterium sp. Leaf93]|uniref:transposase n=1 Tax=Methylobacterium sp. Leaf93 TaxID=1736249 RepID=UPI001FCE1854